MGDGPVNRSWRLRPDIAKETQGLVTAALHRSGVSGITLHGIDQMWFMKFEKPEAENRFVALAAEHGALFKRGAYNFAALAHDEEALVDIEAAASNAFVAMREEEQGS